MNSNQELNKKTRSMEITIKAVIIDEDQKVLLLKRSREEITNAGKWDLPGGRLEKDETVEECVRREILEETGLEVEVEQILKVAEFSKNHKLFKEEKRGLRYLARLKDGQNPGKVKLNPREHEKFEWLSINQAIEALGKDGFEGEKRETLLAAKEYLIRKKSFPVSVRTIVINKNGKCLVLKRSKKDRIFPGCWDFPGGAVEAGEEMRKVAERETEEETGLKVELGPAVSCQDAFLDYSMDTSGENRLGLFIKEVFFIAFCEDENVILSEEHKSSKWLEIDEAIEKLKNNDFEKHERRALLEAKKYLESKKAVDNWKRALADLDNFRKRMAREQEDFRKYCTEDLVLELLPVIDNFEASVAHVPRDKQDDPWVTGIMYIKNQLLKVLEDRGVAEIPVKIGDKIDENIHEVLEGKGGKVKEIVRKGYRLNGKVVRAGQVKT